MASTSSGIVGKTDLRLVLHKGGCHGHNCPLSLEQDNNFNNWNIGTLDIWIILMYLHYFLTSNALDKYVRNIKVCKQRMQLQSKLSSVWMKRWIKVLISKTTKLGYWIFQLVNYLNVLNTKFVSHRWIRRIFFTNVLQKYLELDKEENSKGWFFTKENWWGWFYTKDTTTVATVFSERREEFRQGTIFSTATAVPDISFTALGVFEFTQCCFRLWPES